MNSLKFSVMAVCDGFVGRLGWPRQHHSDPCVYRCSTGAKVLGGCKGKRATIVGTGGVVRGTSHRDVIVLTGASTVFAGGGNDLICGSNGADEIPRRSWPDRIFGPQRRRQICSVTKVIDSVNGGAGDDSIEGGSGRDRSSGGWTRRHRRRRRSRQSRGTGRRPWCSLRGTDDHGNHDWQPQLVLGNSSRDPRSTQIGAKKFTRRHRFACMRDVSPATFRHGLY